MYIHVQNKKWKNSFKYHKIHKLKVFKIKLLSKDTEEYSLLFGISHIIETTITSEYRSRLQIALRLLLSILNRSSLSDQNDMSTC